MASTACPDIGDLPANAHTHYSLHRLAALSCVASYVAAQAERQGKEPRDVLHEFNYLGPLIDEFVRWMPSGHDWRRGPTWWSRAVLEWERSVAERLPLRSLAESLRAPFASRMALILSGLVEDDFRIGSLYAALQEPLVSRRPCVSLLSDMLRTAFRDAMLQPCEPWWPLGVLEPQDRSAPRSEWTLRVPPDVWQILRGADVAAAARETEDIDEWSSLLNEFDDGESLRLLPERLESGDLSAVVLQGANGSGRRRLARSLARALGRNPCVVDVPEDDRERARFRERLGLRCVLSFGFPILCVDPRPGGRAVLPALPGYRGPAVVCTGREGGVGGELVRSALTCSMPAPSLACREAVWANELGETEEGVSPPEVAQSFYLPIEYARRVARSSRQAARLDGRKRVGWEDLRAARRALGQEGLDRLAQRMDARGGWDDLITSENSKAALREFELFCRRRHALGRDLGIAFRNVRSRGARALLHGPSGSGKTLAARILASVLGKDLFRADLGAIHDKWVGESEKAVSELLARAEELDVVLLVDEGDSLLAPRTTVRSASDKYSNLLSNHLLQRLESFDGILVVTTNALSRTDAAFARRFDSVIELLKPDAVRRRRLWELHLPAQHEIDEQALEEIARQCTLSGGQIRNAVLRANLAAAESGRRGRPRSCDLQRAVEVELMKAGERGSRGNGRKRRGNARRIQRFLERAQ
jgi:hypothetical protein